MMGNVWSTCVSERRRDGERRRQSPRGSQESILLRGRGWGFLFPGVTAGGVTSVTAFLASFHKH